MGTFSPINKRQWVEIRHTKEAGQPALSTPCPHGNWEPQKPISAVDSYNGMSIQYD